MLTELTLLAIGLIILFRVLVFKSRTDKLLEKIPGPKAYPIIGNILDFSYPQVAVTETMKQFSYKYGPVCRMWLGTEPYVLIRNPEDVELVLGSSFITDKPKLYEILFPWFRQGLLTSKGDLWKRHRKILTPAFHYQILEQFIPIFNKHSHIYVEKLGKKVGQEMDVTEDLPLCTLDIICETGMGLEIKSQQGESKYADATKELVDITAYRSFNFIQRTFLFHIMPVGRRAHSLVSFLNSVTKKVTKDRRALLQIRDDERETEASSDNDNGKKKRKVFLDLMLEYNKEGAGFTDDEIMDEISTFLFAGFDSTSTTTSFCLYSISQNPDVQEKVYKEQKQIFGDSERDCTFQDLQEMKYLDKVIKETLRRYPTIQFIGRLCDKDLELRGGYIVPRNTPILVMIEAMNHNPELYTDPLKFDPDRFDERSSNPYTFVPFAAGQRNCIGQKYAFMEMKCVISLVLRKFHLFPSDVPITFWFDIVLKSKTGVHLRFEPRVNSSS